MSSSDQSLITSIKNAIIQVNRYMPLFIFITGIIGNLLNILVLSRPTLRLNPCAFIFFVSSITSLITIISGLTARLTAGWAVDLSETIGWLCKIRIFVLFGSRMIAVWLLTFAAIDRWLSSSRNVHQRNLSSLKNAQRSIALVTLFSFLLNGPLLYCFEANLIGTPIKCYGYSDACRLYSNVSFTLGTLVVPAFFMLVFGLLMINNIRQLQRRVNIRDTSRVNGTSTNTPVSVHIHQQQQQKKKTDRSLLKMVFVQVLFLILCIAPYTIYELYATLTPAATAKSALQNTIEGLVFNLCINLTYLATAMPFYIYTLCGGELFRHELFSVLKNIYQKFQCA